MTRLKNHLSLFTLIICLGAISNSCKQESANKDQALNSEISNNNELEVNSTSIRFNPPKEFNEYWYGGEAEISSYKLEQARYGEIREGHAVLVYVTEPFLPGKQVKADNQKPNNISVLKLNATKNFKTGIYPYSIMQSTFYPVDAKDHAIKVSASVQEWCGQVYTQINNRNQFEVTSHSYFETEADENFKLEKSILENELWTKLRIDPEALPTGSIEVIPSLEFIRLKHVPLKAYSAKAAMNNGNYTLEYPELNRSLSINFNPEFPYEILSWEETFRSGFGANAQKMTTTATKLNSIKSAYWSKNSNASSGLRDELKLD